jgi:hypothetical protein
MLVRLAFFRANLIAEAQSREQRGQRGGSAHTRITRDNTHCCADARKRGQICSFIIRKHPDDDARPIDRGLFVPCAVCGVAEIKRFRPQRINQAA